jgi:hypothetical protein
VLSPALQVPLHTPLKSANRILMKYGSKASDYSKLFGIERRIFFHDPGHMNNLGAEIFTDKIISDLLLKE